MVEILSNKFIYRLDLFATRNKMEFVALKTHLLKQPPDKRVVSCTISWQLLYRSTVFLNKFLVSNLYIKLIYLLRFAH
jgi:hypothetical protein